MLLSEVATHSIRMFCKHYNSLHTFIVINLSLAYWITISVACMPWPLTHYNLDKQITLPFLELFEEHIANQKFDFVLQTFFMECIPASSDVCLCSVHYH